MADPFWQRFCTPLAERILALVQSPTTGPAQDAPFILEETIAQVLGDGRYVVGGDALPTKGTAKLRAGQRVHVFWRAGRRERILTHQWQRAQTGGHQEFVTVEALWATADRTGFWYLTPTSAALTTVPLGGYVNRISWSPGHDDRVLIEMLHSPPVEGSTDTFRSYRVTRSGAALTLEELHGAPMPYPSQLAYLAARGYPPGGYVVESGTRGTITFPAVGPGGRLLMGLSRRLVVDGAHVGPVLGDLVDIQTGEVVIRGNDLALLLGTGPGHIKTEFGVWPYYLDETNPARSVIVVHGWSHGTGGVWIKALAVDGSGALRAEVYPWTPEFPSPPIFAPGLVDWDGKRPSMGSSTSGWIPAPFGVPATPGFLAWRRAHPGTGTGAGADFVARLAPLPGPQTVLSTAHKVTGNHPLYDPVTREIQGLGWYAGGREGGRDHIAAIAYEWLPTDPADVATVGTHVFSGYFDGGASASRLKVHMIALPFAIETDWSPHPTTGNYRVTPRASMLDARYPADLELQAPPAGSPLDLTGEGFSLHVVGPLT